MNYKIKEIIQKFDENLIKESPARPRMLYVELNRLD